MMGGSEAEVITVVAILFFSLQTIKSRSLCFATKKSAATVVL